MGWLSSQTFWSIEITVLVQNLDFALKLLRIIVKLDCLVVVLLAYSYFYPSTPHIVFIF